MNRQKRCPTPYKLRYTQQRFIWVHVFKTVVLCAITLVVACMALALYGRARWNACTTQLLNRLDAAQIKSAPQFYKIKELEGLPARVKRYFETVLKDDQPIITAATVQHTGTFNMSATAENWKPFASTQRVITKRPGFDWDARVMIFPSIAAHIHDAYIAGSGMLKVAVLGLVPVADLPETADLSKAEFMRFCIEAPWYRQHCCHRKVLFVGPLMHSRQNRFSLMQTSPPTCALVLVPTI